MLALLTYSILELKVRRSGLQVTGEAILKAFAHLALVYTLCKDGSVLVRLTPLTAFQRRVVAALDTFAWPFALSGQSTALSASGSSVVLGQLRAPYRLPLLA